MLHKAWCIGEWPSYSNHYEDGQAIQTIYEVCLALPIKHTKKGFLKTQAQVFWNTENKFPFNILSITRANNFLTPSTIPLADLGQGDHGSAVPLQLPAPAWARLMWLEHAATSCGLLLQAFPANSTTDLPLEAFRKPRSQDPQQHLYCSPFPPAGSLLHSTFKIGKQKWVTARISTPTKVWVSSPSVADFLACPLVLGYYQGPWIVRGHKWQTDLPHVSQGYPTGMTTLIFLNSWNLVFPLPWRGQEVNVNKRKAPPACWISLENILIPQKCFGQSQRKPNQGSFVP